jgi:hypothetical protein
MALEVDVDGKSRGLGGLWRYLIARTRGRTLERLEELRNEATAAAIQTLPCGAELEEYEAHGRYRRIRMPAESLPVIVLCSQPEGPPSLRRALHEHRSESIT